MKIELLNKMNNFYSNMAIVELNEMNKSTDCKISYNTILYLDIIYNNNGLYTASSLADLIGVTKPGVIQKINYLVEKGYINKKQDSKDKRVYYLYINEENLNLYMDFKKKEKKIYEYIHSSFSKEEIETFLNVLDTIEKKRRENGN